MRRLPLVAAVLLCAGLVSGCSTSVQLGDTSAGPSAENTSAMKTYTDDTFGFSFQYPENFQLNPQASFAGQGGGQAKESVAVFDTQGAQIGGQYRDAFVVSVYPLNVTVDSSNIDKAKAELESSVLPQLRQSTPGMEIGSLTETTVAGAPGFKTEASFDLEGTPVRSELYFVFAGSTEYQILTQAVTENWDTLQPTFAQMIDSLILPTGSPSPAATD